MTQEETFVRTFIAPERRARYLYKLRHTKHGRDWLTGEMIDSGVLDPRWMQDIPPSEQFAESIHNALVARGAPETCYVIGGPDEMDGREVSLLDALVAVVGWSWDTVLSCIPRKLAYYEGHEPSDRYILDRASPGVRLR